MPESRDLSQVAVDERRGGLPAAVAVVGGLALVLLIAVTWSHQKRVDQDLITVRAIGQIQADLAISHLWLEEYVSGDRVDLDEVATRLERGQSLSTFLAVTIRESALSEGLRPAPREAGEAMLRQEAPRLRDAFEEFRQMSVDRQVGHQRGLDVGIGSSFDIAYDRVFAIALGHAQALDNGLENRRRERREHDRLSFAVIFAGWTLMIGLASAGLWTHEHRRAAAVADLRASQKKLERVQKLETVGRVAGGLAHDINNYLAAIRSQCELVLMRSSADDAAVPRMHAAIGAVSRASELINRLLAFSRRRPARLEATDLNALLRAMEPMLAPLAGENVCLHWRLQKDLWPIAADRSQIEQLVVNLVVNARDAMAASGGNVWIVTDNILGNHVIRNPVLGSHVSGSHADDRPTGEDAVRLHIADDGPGIEEHLRDQIFEPFWSTKDDNGHGGLGLAIVADVAEKHQASLSVDSTLDHCELDIDIDGHAASTVFTVAFPRSPQAPATAHATAATKFAKSASLEGSERLLLVDDNEEYRESTAALLETLGYSVTTAADGREAAEQHHAATIGFDVLLVDVGLPDVDGPTLINRLQEHAQTRGDLPAPAILLSGHGSDTLERRGLGNRRWVAKSAPTQALLTAIRQALESSTRKCDA